MTIEIGVRVPHYGSEASPARIVEWCTYADEAGLDSLWGADHVIMPRHVDSMYTLGRTPSAIAPGAISEQLAPNFELVTTLAFAAAVTTRIKLATGVEVLTIRNPVLNAHQIATIDRYSDGRVLLGVGVGWLKEEADAMGLPWDKRGARADEHIALLRALWAGQGDVVEFHGEFWDIPPIDPEPLPVQRPIPILIGGHSAAAIDRAARIGDGWIAAGVTPSRLQELLPEVRAACDRNDRAIDSLPIYCRSKSASVESIRAYADVGVRSVQVDIDTFDDLRRFVDDVLPIVR